MINDDTHIPIELPFGNQVPTQAEILKRFKGRYLHPEYLLPLLTTCAEEAERMMHERFTEMKKKPVTIRKSKTPNGSTVRQSGYFCPRCGFHKVHITHNYCPGCGNEINWT